jgi:hypothetical protein
MKIHQIFQDIPEEGHTDKFTREYPKVSGLSRNEINNNNNKNKHPFRSNTKGYGDKTH